MAFTIKVNGQTYRLGVGDDMPLLCASRAPRFEAYVIPVSEVRNSARAAMARLALAGVLVATANFQAHAQNCPPGYKIAAGACVQSCPGGYEDTGRICVYRRQGGGSGS
jgi:hypothetical protein